MSFLLATIISIPILTATILISKYFARKHAKPKVDAIEAIGEMDIPIGEKIRLMNKIK